MPTTNAHFPKHRSELIMADNCQGSKLLVSVTMLESEEGKDPRTCNASEETDCQKFDGRTIQYKSPVMSSKIVRIQGAEVDIESFCNMESKIDCPTRP